MDIITSVLNDRFEIARTLSEDGPTSTYLALDTQTGQEVVLKELNLGQAFDWKSIELFERESKILQHLKHPTIPGYVDAFRTDNDSRLFIAQQHIEGESLQTLIDNATPFNESRIREFLDQMLDMLAYLHDFSPPVIHRDIKPTNILCDGDGRFHLVNFGAVQTIIQDKIGGSTIVGTTGYMPPEQLLGRAAPATDIYSLAATCVHLASGKNPADLPSKRMKLQFRDHVSLSEPLCNILEKMLEPDTSLRFTRPEQVQNALKSGRIERPESPKSAQALERPNTSTALTQFNDLKKLIADPAVLKPISKVELTEKTLTIIIQIQRKIPWLAMAVIGFIACSMLIVGFANNNIGMCCLGFPLLFLGIPTILALSRKQDHGSYEQITISPQEIELTKGKIGQFRTVPIIHTYLQLPLQQLTNCYLESDFERFVTYANGGQTPRPPGGFKLSGIYFVDDQNRKYHFRTTGITKGGRLITSSPHAFHEIEWLYEIVQTYLQAVTTSADFHSQDLIETQDS